MTPVSYQGNFKLFLRYCQGHFKGIAMPLEGHVKFILRSFQGHVNSGQVGSGYISFSEDSSR
jgi:hypothetical protein